MIGVELIKNRYIMELKSTLDYIPGQVARRVVLDSVSGIVMLLAFDGGTEIATHSAPADVLVQMLEGELEFTLEGTPVKLHAGDFITMAPGARHSLKAISRSKVLVTKLNAPK